MCPTQNLDPTGDRGGAAADWAVVERVRAGDDASYDVLMQRYKRPVLNFVYRMIGDAAEAEDVAQEVFVRAYRGLLREGFGRTSANFSTWLFQIARNAALDCLRRRRRHAADPLPELDGGGESLPGAGKTAAEELMARETGEQIAAAVAVLPEDQRSALVLAEYEALSYEEIAAVMRSSRKSVEARLYRARLFLRQRLAHLLR